MKKIISISIVSLLGILVLSFAGLAYAQGSTPTQPAPAYPGGGVSGQMGAGRWGVRSGVQAGFGMVAETGPWHEAVIASLAEAFGMTPETLQARLDQGETIWQVADSLGWTGEQLQAEMLAARSAALQQAVADGNLTQEQADFMAQRTNQGWPEGYGPGSASCNGSGSAHEGLGRQAGGGRGMRWNSQPTP